MIVALSGPAASGKGTLAGMLATYLNLPHYDFGLIFRAIAYTNKPELLVIENREVFFEGHNITKILFTEEVGLIAAKVSHTLKDATVLLVKHTSFVCDGRTCGTEIYPNADYKFYITADRKERFDRRSNDGGNKEVMSKREDLDSTKLVIPNNAIVIDTSRKTKEESLKELISYL